MTDLIPYNPGVTPEVIQDNEDLSLQNSFKKLMSNQFKRIDKFDTLMNLIESKIFTPELVELSNDFEYLLRIHSILESKKGKSEKLALRVLDMANKNQLMTQLIKGLVETNRTNSNNLNTANPDPKVAAAVNLLKQRGLQATHGIRKNPGE